MILCRDRKIGIFLPPKTGTTTICKVFADNVPVFYNQHQHYNYNIAIKIIGESIKKYKFFCFYRDPIDRFISSISFWKKKDGSSVMTDPNPIVHKVVMDGFITKYYDEVRNWEKNKPLFPVFFTPQKYWLGFDFDLTILDFSNYESELKKALSFFTDKDIQIPKLNPSEIRLNVTEDQKVKIKEMYFMDYEFEVNTL